jgi:hypothetical protein
MPEGRKCKAPDSSDDTSACICHFRPMCDLRDRAPGAIARIVQALALGPSGIGACLPAVQPERVAGRAVIGMSCGAEPGNDAVVPALP